MSFIIEKREAFIMRCAAHAIRKFEPGIIAVTGGIGKTAARIALTGVMRDIRSIQAANEDANKSLRLPFTALGIVEEGEGFFFWARTLLTATKTGFIGTHYPELLILECPANESRQFMTLTRPQITIVTALGNESEADAGRLLSNLPSNGYAVINRDDERTRSIALRTRARAITFGFTEEADLIMSDFSHRSEKLQTGNRPAGISFKARYGNQSAHVVMDNAFGKAAAYAAAAAMCVGTAFGLHLARTAEALRYLDMPKNNMGLSIGKKGTYVLNDTAARTEEAIYNALETAEAMPAKRVIGVFGTAKKTDGAWRMQDTLNRLALRTCDAILTVGDSPVNVDSKKKLRFDNGESAAAELQAITERGDLILITGQGLDAVVDSLCSYRLVVRT